MVCFLPCCSSYNLKIGNSSPEIYSVSLIYVPAPLQSYAPNFYDKWHRREERNTAGRPFERVGCIFQCFSRGSARVGHAAAYDVDKSFQGKICFQPFPASNVFIGLGQNTSAEFSASPFIFLLIFGATGVEREIMSAGNER